ncbi:Amyloid beta A4 precursor protein-binding family B member 2 [Acipenser ruthenus]|uniref:Amyloid beta A4 protein-binding family B member 2 n=1 Tax=Acipenser ruthenus TaxID=7906 RepID=A0A444V351_ACIRT|nr:Amyloid beta A4 precursor protein-binding family B member 2 [Acipenser ruthenus]
MSLEKTTDLTNDTCLQTPLRLNLQSPYNALLDPEIRKDTSHNEHSRYEEDKHANNHETEQTNKPTNENANDKWVKEGQNQLNKAAVTEKQDQNHNLQSPSGDSKQGNEKRGEKETPAKGFIPFYSNLKLSAENLAEETSSFVSLQGHTVKLVGEKNDVKILETELQKDDSKSVCLSLEMRNSAQSDEDSSWTSLSQDNTSYSPDGDSDHFWNCNPFETDTDLPAGWMRVRDTSGTYYWHVPTGTTQWDPPSLAGETGRPSSTSQETPHTVEQNELQADEVTPDHSLREFEGATLRYASLNLRRQLYMLLNSPDTKLNIAFRFCIDGIEYIVFAFYKQMKCYVCGCEGHIAKNCKRSAAENDVVESDTAVGSAEPASQEVRPSVENVRVESDTVGTTEAVAEPVAAGQGVLDREQVHGGEVWEGTDRNGNRQER